MNYQKTCECCGHIRVAYTMPINKSMVGAFIKFTEKYLKKEKGIAKGDIGLTNAQYSNFQNLRHYEIIHQGEKGREWYLTDKGLEFYLGEISLLTPVAHMGGVTLGDDHEAWNTHPKKRERKFISDIESTHFKTRQEYQQEKSPRM